MSYLSQFLLSFLYQYNKKQEILLYSSFNWWYPINYNLISLTNIPYYLQILMWMIIKVKLDMDSQILI